MPDLDALTKAELKDYATAHGIVGLNDRMLKADIISAIKEGMGWM